MKSKEVVEAAAVTAPAPVDVNQFAQRREGLIDQAQPVAKIRTEAERELIAKLRVAVKDLKKDIGAKLDPIVASAHQTWQLNLTLRREQLDPLDQLDTRLGKMQNVDFQEQQAAAAKRQAALQAKADVKAETARDAEVEALKSTGQTEEAAALAATPVQAQQVVVGNKAALTAAAAGLTFRIQRHMRIVDAEKLDRKYLIPNEDAIKAVGVALWERLKPKDANDAAAFIKAAAAFAASTEVAGVEFTVTKESADTGRRK